MAIFVVAHGAWSAGWGWKKMHPLMRERGHELYTPTYTGLGERAHLAHPDIDLDTHISDIVGMLEYEDLRDVMLIGHSYGGMVATGVADRARSRIAKLIYIDAFAPRDGDSALDLLPPGTRAQRQAGSGGVESWQIPPAPMPPDTSDEDRAWAMPRRVPQPAKTFSQKLKLSAESTAPRHYVYCLRAGPEDRFRPFYERAKREGWGADEIDASHNPHITNPVVLAYMLDLIAKR
jgi:pimeloyl-ACP methyl ester carboxylesterase